jgi:hypothetical protein
MNSKKIKTTFFRAPMWKSGLNFKEKLTNPLKMAQPTSQLATKLEKPIKMLLRP